MEHGCSSMDLESPDKPQQGCSSMELESPDEQQQGCSDQAAVHDPWAVLTKLENLQPLSLSFDNVDFSMFGGAFYVCPLPLHPLHFLFCLKVIIIVLAML